MKIINDNGIDRPMTPQEQAAHDAFEAQEAKRIQQEVAAREAAAAAKASARTKLAALGLTDAEIAAFLGA